MAMYDAPEHRCSTFTVVSGRDDGGGTRLTYPPPPAQSGIPCQIRVASSATKDLFSRQQINVSTTVAFLASVLTTPLTPGMQIVDDATGGTLRIQGIRAGHARGNVPAFVYADCSENL